MSYYLIKTKNSDICLSIYKSLSNKGMESKIVTTPNFLGNGCGLSVRLEDNVYKEIVNEIQNENHEFDDLDIYKIEVLDNNEYKYTNV